MAITLVSHVADFDYAKMQATASALLSKFNQGVITYIPLVSGANDYDPKTDGTPVTLSATSMGVQTQYLTDLITSSDIQVTAAVFGAVPSNDGVITLDGVRRSVIKVEAIPATGTTVAWRIFVKG